MYNAKMKRHCVVLAVMMSCAAVAQDETNLAAFREARFGMFIHWGLYSQLGGRYKGRQMPEKIGEWIQSSFRIPNAEYSRLARTFNPTNFDADAWAKAAKDAGMGYVVLTTKHHEGFSMFATKASAYNIVGATPFGRDVFGELAAACRRQGLKVGLYYSQNLDWHERDGGDPRSAKGMYPNGNMDWGNTWDWPDCSKKDLNRYLKSKVYPQLKELLTNYGDIFLVWFDTSFGMTPEQSRELREYVRSLSPKTIVNSRIGNGCGDFGSMGDNELVTNRCDFVSESAITLNDTWGFRYDDHNWKSAYTVATFLANNLSHDANIILNVGPRPDGRFPDATCDVLSDLGEWQRRTGFKIKGAGPGPFRGTLPWGWCLSVDGNILQLVIRREWKGEIVLKGLKNDVVSSTARWRKDGEAIVVTPSCDPDLMPRVVRIELDDAPKM